jgi:hypothetical protein
VLRSVRWNEENAIKRAEETAVWRRAFPADLPAERVSVEGETGKELVFGYDNDCRPVLYMVSTLTHFGLSACLRPSRQWLERA